MAFHFCLGRVQLRNADLPQVETQNFIASKDVIVTSLIQKNNKYEKATNKNKVRDAKEKW